MREASALLVKWVSITDANSDVLTFSANVNAAWRTSMEVGIRAEAENLSAGETRHTSSAYLTMVAVDDPGRPTQVEPLLVTSLAQERREGEAELRRANRSAERR